MKIILVDLLYIGDLLFTTPAIHVLHQAFPDAQIDALVNVYSREVVLHNPYLHRVMSFDTSGPSDRLGPFYAFIRSLRREQYDLAISLHDSSERSTMLTAFCGAKRIVGYGKRAIRWMYHLPLVQPEKLHPSDAYLETLATIGIPRQSSHHGLEMWPGDEALQRADALWREAGLADNGQVIGLNPGGSFPTKHWTVAGFAALCDLLRRDGYTPVLFGGPTDIVRAGEICAHCATPPIVFTGQLSLLELVAMIGKCQGFVSGDSGPMHMAASQQTPVVAIFGPTDWTQFYPYGVTHRIVTSDDDCLQCGKRECPDMRCMRNISPERVYTALKEIIT